MKKRIVSILSLLLALLLLAGCRAGEHAVAFVTTDSGVMPRGEFTQFDEIEYIRPDMAEMDAVVVEIFNALENPLKYKELKPLVEEFFRLSNNFDTMYSLAYIRNCKDMSDEFYAEEYSWLMAEDSYVQQCVQAVTTACENSPQLRWLESFKFWESYSQEDTQGLEDYERYSQLRQREAELVAQYRSQAADPVIEMDGEKWRLEDYILARPYKPGEAERAYNEKYNALVGEIYLELISLRREMAELLGYESYAAMEYTRSYSRDYSPEQAEEYLSYIKQHMAPLGREIAEAGLYYAIDNMQADARDLKLLLETATAGFGGSLEEAYKFMIAHGLYDFEYSSKKAESSFQIYLTDYQAPYLFLHPYGNFTDIITVFHEFGHYADSYMRYNAPESIDLSECFSHAMQFLALPEIGCVLNGEELRQISLRNMLNITDIFLQQSALAEFELRAHEMEEPTLEKLNELCLQLSHDYGYYDDTLAEAYSYSWTNISHLFESPFYVISYPVSAAVALQLYELELEEKGAGVAKFMEMSQSRLPRLMETLEYAGLQSPISQQRIIDCTELLRRSIFE